MLVSIDVTVPIQIFFYLVITIYLYNLFLNIEFFVSVDSI